MRTLAFLLSMMLSSATVAGVSGLEDARDLSVTCDKGAKVEAEMVPTLKEKVCFARGASCDVKDAGELLFHANIDVACKLENNACPTVEVCATKKLTGALADAVRLRLDPNNATREDGSVNPHTQSKKAGQ